MGNTAKTVLALLAALGCSCSRPAPFPGSAAPPGATSAAATPLPAYEAALPADLRQIVDKPFTGDLDQMVQRRLIRIGVPFNRTFYFVDKGVQRGLAYEYATLFEDQLNKSLQTGPLKVHVVLLPMTRDALIPQLRAGKIDMAVAQLTITPERRQLVDFSNPTRPNVDEVLVTGPAAPQVSSPEALGGVRVYVRRSSSYYASLQSLNRRRAAAGHTPALIETAPESLEDDDILEMVNAGLVPATVVDDYLADFWKQMFPNLAVHHDAPLRTGGNLAVAIRKGSPRLAAALNDFIAKYGLSTAIGRVLNQRYLQDTHFAKEAASEGDRKKFVDVVSMFRQYGDQYRFDYLLMAAQGYQESGLNQGAKSRVGAVGVMQLMPATGQEQKVGDIHKVDPNIHAGVKYMRFMRDRYFEDQPMDDLNKGLFTFAAYNAGIGRIQQLRKEAAQRGLNPNVWFGNVELIASERIGRETVTYVSNIYKYYLAYRLITQASRERSAAKASAAKTLASAGHEPGPP